MWVYALRSPKCSAKEYFFSSMKKIQLDQRKKRLQTHKLIDKHSLNGDETQKRKDTAKTE